jgi:hypothetical protein
MGSFLGLHVQVCVLTVQVLLCEASNNSFEIYCVKLIDELRRKWNCPKERNSLHQNQSRQKELVIGSWHVTRH